jgi:hypothetical protein
MLNPGVREFNSKLKSASDDMVRVADILRENNDKWSSL